ncbi:hypothetical protein ABPG72_012055 [Tetrahymena utriculariae]
MTFLSIKAQVLLSKHQEDKANKQYYISNLQTNTIAVKLQEKLFYLLINSNYQNQSTQLQKLNSKAGYQFIVNQFRNRLNLQNLAFFNQKIKQCQGRKTNN